MITKGFIPSRESSDHPQWVFCSDGPLTHSELTAVKSPGSCPCSWLLSWAGKVVWAPEPRPGPSRSLPPSTSLRAVSPGQWPKETLASGPAPDHMLCSCQAPGLPSSATLSVRPSEDWMGVRGRCLVLASHPPPTQSGPLKAIYFSWSPGPQPPSSFGCLLSPGLY